MSHPGNHDILRFLKGEQDPPARQRLVEHLRDCAGCRARVEHEAAFDRLLRLETPYAQAPPHLIDRLRAGLQTAVARQRRGRRPGIWLSSGAAAVAAALSFLMIVGPGHSGHLAEGLLAAGPVAGVVENLKGRLVCVGCARLGAPLSEQMRCRGGVAQGHETGLLDAGGRLWRFVASANGAELLADPGLRGNRVEVSARRYNNIDYLRVYAVQTL